MYKKIFREFCLYIGAVIIMSLCFMLVKFSSIVKDGIISGTQRCFNIIIPSLFAFMAVSAIIINTGIYEKISSPFFIISKYILKIPKSLFFVFLIGNIAGYPMGIKLLSSMVKKGQISQSTAEIMSLYCYCGGPAFYSGAIGLTVFGSAKIGMIIFLSIIISNTIICIAINRIFNIREKQIKSETNFSSQILTDSILSAGKSLFTVCVMIVFFSAAMALAENSGIFSFAKNTFGLSDNGIILVKSFFEITCISQLKGSPYNLLPIISALCSFGGICVIIQLFALNQNGFSLKKFIASRPLCALFSGIVCKILSWQLLPKELPADTSCTKFLVKTDNFIPSICLILMILLLGTQKRLAIYRKV